jgi:hypothetical protein
MELPADIVQPFLLGTILKPLIVITRRRNSPPPLCPIISRALTILQRIKEGNSHGHHIPT